MLTHHDLEEAAHVRLEALREEAKRHREADHKPSSLWGVLASWRRNIARLNPGNNLTPAPPSPSANRLWLAVDSANGRPEDRPALDRSRNGTAHR
jgi:hypothetical protein